MAKKQINVLVVDDSAVVRRSLSDLFESDPGMQVESASDPIFAMKKMEKVWPDVIVLDIEMPRMDGLTFLKKIMGERPTPVVICSSLAQAGANLTMEALSAGAIEIITKPKIGLKNFLDEESLHILESVRAASKARMASPVLKVEPKLSADAVLSPARRKSSDLQTTDRVVALGTSTGGTQALADVLSALPATAPGIVIVQHMPELFTKAFAERLNTLCAMEVREAQNGDRVHTGLALIAPGNYHMMLKRSGAYYLVEVADGPLVSRHRPSVDVLFRSVAKHAGKNALGIIMTGMGDDGANGLLEMREAGADTIAQDEASCVVYGMPKEAVKRGAAASTLPLDKLPRAIMKVADS